MDQKKRYLISGIKNEKGIALLLVLSIVAILTAVTMQIHYQMSQSMIAAGITKDRFLLKEAAVSGVQAAMGMLAKDRKENETDSTQEDWANKDKIAEVLMEIPMAGYKREVTITDELGKLQVNALLAYHIPHPDGEGYGPPVHNDHENMWKALLDSLFVLIEQDDKISEEFKETIKEKSGTSIVIDSIIDWIDPETANSGSRTNGAEFEYYGDLDPPYKPKNGPITDIDEMLLIRGVLPEIFKGMGEHSLTNYISVFGAALNKKTKSFYFPGKVNIGTAPKAVLIGLLGIENEGMADDIIEYREETGEKGKYSNELGRDKKWYTQVTGWSGLKLGKRENLITTSSDIFKIVSKATLGEESGPSEEEGEEEEDGDDDDDGDERGRGRGGDDEEDEKEESLEDEKESQGVSTTITAIVQRVQDKKSKKWQCKILKWKTE